jgi:hypothetical protein
MVVVVVLAASLIVAEALVEVVEEVAQIVLK